MEFTISRQDLLNSIVPLAAIAPTKNAMPILTNYLIEADADKNLLSFTATDLEINVIAELEADVAVSGSAAVSARNFTSIIHSLSDDKIRCRRDDDLLKIMGNRSEFSLLCAETSQYPLIPAKNLENAVSLDAELFKRMVAATGFAVSTESNRAIFTGVFWKISAEGQVMAATDGKKIAEFKDISPLPVTEALEQIMPTKGLGFLTKVINENCLELKVLLEKNRVMFEYDNFTIFSHVLEGRYPDYSKAIPQDHPNVLTIDKTVLAGAIKRVSLLASDETFRIKFALSARGVEISTFDRDQGEAREELPGDYFKGEELEITFNYRFLLQIIGAVGGEKINIRFGKSKEAIVLTGSDNTETHTALYLLMPLRMT